MPHGLIRHNKPVMHHALCVTIPRCPSGQLSMHRGSLCHSNALFVHSVTRSDMLLGPICHTSCGYGKDWDSIGNKYIFGEGGDSIGNIQDPA